MKEYGEKIAAFDKELRATVDPASRDLPFLDFRKIDLAGVQALDDHTLRVRLNGKYPQFKYWLTMVFTAPVPWEADKFYAQPGFTEKNLSLNYWPVGTGPYMLTEYQENRRHVLERNPNFGGETYPCEGEAADRAAKLLDDCGKPLPLIDRVVFNIEKERIPLKAKFMQGYYDNPEIYRFDWLQDLEYDVRNSDQVAKLFRDRGIQMPRTLEISNWYVGFNWLDPVVGKGRTPEEQVRNRKLRQALSIAVDWEEFVRVFESKAAGEPAMGPVPPGVFGFRPEAINRVVYDVVDGKPKRKSIDEAKRLLAEAGYPDGRDAKSGRPLVLNYDYQRALTPELKAEVEWMARQFAKINVQLEIRATDYNRFQEKAEKGLAAGLLVGLVRRLPGRGELPVPAVRPELQGADRRQRRERVELQQSRIRQAVRRAEVPRRRRAQAAGDRPDGRDHAAGRAVDVRLQPVRRLGEPPVGRQREARAAGQRTADVHEGRPGAARGEDRRVEPPGLVAGRADGAGARRRRAARVPRVEAPRARDRGPPARERGALTWRATSSGAASTRS